MFVNHQERTNWCQQNVIPYIPPLHLHQQTQEQGGQTTPTQVPATDAPWPGQLPADFPHSYWLQADSSSNSSSSKPPGS